MVTIAVNLGDVQGGFEDLPLGQYLGEVEKVAYLEAKEAGKSPQLRVQYLVIDGEYQNRRQSQFLYLSEKALGFVKDFFAKFGLGDTENFEVDEEIMELTDPDIVGSQVIFEVALDKKDATRIRTNLVSVEDNTSSGATSAAAVIAEPEAVAAVAAAAGPAPRRPSPRQLATSTPAAATPQRRTLR